jgi:hypothetical protein
MLKKSGADGGNIEASGTLAVIAEMALCQLLGVELLSNGREMVFEEAG